MLEAAAADKRTKRDVDVSRQNVLRQHGLIQHVLAFASADGHLFAGCVSRLWRESWLGKEKEGESEAASGDGGDGGGITSPAQIGKDTPKLPKETPFAAVVTSVSRLTWSLDSGLEWSDRLTKAAARVACGLDALKWGLNHGDVRFEPEPLNVASLVTAAAKAGHLETLKWARANGSAWDSSLMNSAARAGHLHVFQWARGEGCPIWSSSYYNPLIGAAQHAHFEVVKWLWENRCPRNAEVCSAAASGGHLEVLQWLRANGADWGNTCAFAAGKGHLEILQWARANGCPWGFEPCAAAARNGHLEILRWARANGCPWGLRFNPCSEAQMCPSSRRQEVLDWLHANGCPCEHTGIPAEEGDED